MYKSELNFTQKTNILFHLMSPWAWYFWSRNLTGISGQSFNNEKKKKNDALHLTNSSPTYVPYPNQHKCSAPSGVHHYLQPIHYRHLFFFFPYPSRVVMVTASSTWNVGHVFWTNDLTMKRTGILRRRRRQGRRSDEAEKRRLKGVCILRLGSWH